MVVLVLFQTQIWNKKIGEERYNMKKFLTITLGAMMLFSGLLFAEDNSCDVSIFKTIKAGDVSSKGAEVFFLGTNPLTIVKDELDMFKIIMSTYYSCEKLQSKDKTCTSVVDVKSNPPTVKQKGFDQAGVVNNLKIQTTQAKPGETKRTVMLGVQAYETPTPIKDSGDDVVSLYYSVLASSYNKFNILSVDPASFDKSVIIQSVKDAFGKIEACEDAKDKVRKELAELIGSAKDGKATYSIQDQETLQSAIDIANNTHDNKAATLQELNKAKQDLTDTRSKLKPVVENKDKKNDPNPKDPNPNESLSEFQKLKELIDYVTDQKSKLPASINGKLDPVVNKAKAVMNDKASTPGQLEDAYNKLDAAYKEALKELLNELIGMIEGELDSYDYAAQPALKDAIKVAKDYIASGDFDVAGLEKAIELLIQAKLSADMEAGKIASAAITDEMIKNEWNALISKLGKNDPAPNKEKKFNTLEEVKKGVPGTDGSANNANVKKGKWSTLDEVKQGVSGVEQK